MEPDSPSHGAWSHFHGAWFQFHLAWARFHSHWTRFHSHWGLIPPPMGLIILAWGAWFHSQGPNSTLCGPDSSKALCGGLLLIIKPSFSFFGFPFRPCYLAGVMEKMENLGGGLFPKKWNAYYYFEKKQKKKAQLHAVWLHQGKLRIWAGWGTSSKCSIFHKHAESIKCRVWLAMPLRDCDTMD